MVRYNSKFNNIHNNTLQPTEFKNIYQIAKFENEKLRKS